MYIIFLFDICDEQYAKSPIFQCIAVTLYSSLKRQIPLAANALITPKALIRALAAKEVFVFIRALAAKNGLRAYQKEKLLFAH